MSNVYDFKKEFKNLYTAGLQPTLMNIPNMKFIMVDGAGDPNENPSYQESIEILYSLCFTIKMSKMGNYQPPGYFDYVVAPLEGLWWISNDKFDFYKRDNWLWTSMIRQPDFVNEEVFKWAVGVAKKKRPNLDFSRARLGEYNEGSCVQILHLGPYSKELATIKMVEEYVKKMHLDEDLISNVRKHHEIYLSDPRKCAPDKLRTIIRHPVKSKF